MSLLSHPVRYRVVLRLSDGTEAALAVREDQHILDVALDAGVNLPFSCLQGWCLTCAAEVVDGEIDQGDSRRFFKEDREAGFALLCTGRPRSDCVVSTHARDRMRRARDEHGLPYPKGDWGLVEES